MINKYNSNCKIYVFYNQKKGLILHFLIVTISNITKNVYESTHVIVLSITIKSDMYRFIQCSKIYKYF
jgi:hypothetical protein